MNTLKATVVVAMWMTAMWMMPAVLGCGGFADHYRSEDAGEQAQVEGQEAAELLYDSMIAVFRQDTEGIDYESADTLTVISDYEAVEEDRRRRFVGRVVPVGGGMGVNITAEYQSDEAGQGESPSWEDEPRERVRAEAEPDELTMARRVERLFNSGGPDG